MTKPAHHRDDLDRRRFLATAATALSACAVSRAAADDATEKPPAGKDPLLITETR